MSSSDGAGAFIGGVIVLAIGIAVVGFILWLLYWIVIIVVSIMIIVACIAAAGYIMACLYEIIGFFYELYELREKGVL